MRIGGNIPRPWVRPCGKWVWANGEWWLCASDHGRPEKGHWRYARTWLVRTPAHEAEPELVAEPFAPD